MKTPNQLARVVAAIVLLTIAASGSAAQSTADNIPVVTLAEARRLAIEVHPAGVAARGDVETSAWERRSALTNLVTPHITAGTTYAAFSDPFFNAGTGGVSSTSTSATVQASYTLFGLGKFAEMKRARASLERATAGETATLYRVALSIDAAYYAVLVNRDLLRVAQGRLERAEEQLTIARARVHSGYAIATDSLQLLLEANKARLEMIRRDSAVAVSQLRLGTGIGLMGAAEAATIDTMLPPPLPFTQQDAIAELRERGPDIVAARAAERHADAAVSVQRAGYLPEITLAASSGAYDSQLFPSALNRSQFLVSVSLPIWNGGERELAIARARAERNVAQAERAERERAAAEVMAAAYKGYGTARAATELAQIGVTAASENYRVQRARYREGSTTILDLLEAQVALSEAESELVQSRYAARLALAQLEALLGRRVFNH